MDTKSQVLIDIIVYNKFDDILKNGKWLLHGQRPYWWVKENAAGADISLLETPLTCETGFKC